MKKASKPLAIIVGGSNFDVAGNCEGKLIPGDSNPGFIKTSAGGVGRNIAENLSRLEFACTLLTAVGNDLGKDIILNSCKEVNINIDHVLISDDSSSGSYLAISDQRGTLVAGVSDMNINEQINVDWLQQKKDVLLAHDIIITEANLPEESLIWLAKNRSGRRLFADAVSATKAPRLRSILSELDVLKVNRDEASAILDLQASDSSLASMLYHDMGVKNVLLSQGSEGVLLYNENGLMHKSATMTQHSNDTGAGDALFSGFIAARYLLKYELQQLEFAVACATVTLNSLLAVCPKLTLQYLCNAPLKHFTKDAWIP